MDVQNTKSVSVDEAQDSFFSLLEEVQEGATITLMRDGEPIAQLTPVTEPSESR